MDVIYVSYVLEEMFYDNVVDILNELFKFKVVSLLILMNKDKVNEIKVLLYYEEDIVGGIMIMEFIFLKLIIFVKEVLIYVKE